MTGSLPVTSSLGIGVAVEELDLGGDRRQVGGVGGEVAEGLDGWN